MSLWLNLTIIRFWVYSLIHLWSLPSSASHSTSLANMLLKVLLGITIAVVLVMIRIKAIIYYYKFHFIPKTTQTRGVSFENPTYLKDTNTIQIHDSRVSDYVSEQTTGLNNRQLPKVKTYVWLQLVITYNN